MRRPRRELGKAAQAASTMTAVSPRVEKWMEAFGAAKRSGQSCTASRANVHSKTGKVKLPAAGSDAESVPDQTARGRDPLMQRRARAHTRKDACGPPSSGAAKS